MATKNLHLILLLSYILSSCEASPNLFLIYNNATQTISINDNSYYIYSIEIANDAMQKPILSINISSDFSGGKHIYDLNTDDHNEYIKEGDFANVCKTKIINGNNTYIAVEIRRGNQQYEFASTINERFCSKTDSIIIKPIKKTLP